MKTQSKEISTITRGLFGTRNVSLSLSVLAVLFVTGCGSDSGGNINGTSQDIDAEAVGDEASVSPARNIQPRRPPPQPGRGPGNTERVYRSIDGTDNNVVERSIGAAATQLRRAMPADYNDGISTLAGPGRESARFISNTVAAQDVSIPNTDGLSDFLWQWGQFLDHDIDLTDGVDPAEPANIVVPTGDVFFDPEADGDKTIPLNRSLYDTATGTGPGNPRQQLNEITAWIDASNVYGSEDDRAESLRLHDGSGQLKTSEGDLLPFNEDGLSNAGGDGADLFLGGDVRVNEQAGLTVMHTLFMREHNRLAAELREQNPDWHGDQIYQEARRWVGAEMQVITYREFLPALLGPNALPFYYGYDSNVDASINNVFAHAAYRVGHTMLSDRIMRLDAAGNEISFGHLALLDAFFNPGSITEEGGIEPFLRGLAGQVSQKIDHKVVDDVRNFLFGLPGAGGFDLASLNIQRGRDHGLPSYNDACIAFGLPTATAFSDVSSDADTQQRLAAAYSSPDDMDIWVAGLAEDALAGSQLGPLFLAILVDQFSRLRDGDRFWYQRTLSPSEQAIVESLTLAEIIRRNTDIGNELADDVFRVSNP